ncbi:MAG: carboxypeptidase-like regulatory domain-containing protein [Actinomycetota bacterium]|nr:carboxypeptidase-like regulatory domain-containing protein [Actinomycetota bacterium]
MTRLRAAAVLTLIGAALVAPATPVAAAPAPVRILSVSAENVKPGDKVRVRFRVTNTGQRAETAIVVVGGGLECASGCRAEPDLGGGASKDFSATLVAPKAHPGEITGLNISIGVRLGGQNHFDFKMVYVHGPGASAPDTEKPKSEVDRVSGRVRDAGGKAVGGVSLTVRDSAGHEYRTTTDRKGRFSITSTAAKPIAKGQITVVASMNGYREARKTVRAAAGDKASVQLVLAAVAAPATTTASPLAVVEEAAEPETSVAAAPPAVRTVSDEGNGPLLFMILGGLLVAAGVAALLRLVLRRRSTPSSPSDAPTAVLHLGHPADPYGNRGR